MTIMKIEPTKTQRPLRACVLTGALAITALPLVAFADNDRGRDGDQDRHGDDTLRPGNLLVSRTVYSNNPANVKVGEILPPDCAATTGGCSAPSGAPFDGTYPNVWNDVLFDASFGITSKIFLDEVTPLGFPLQTIAVPAETSHGRDAADHLVTSFSSKSELALNLSTDGRFITFMGYVAAPDTVDVSNSNTPGAVDISNPVGTNFLRAVAQMDAKGHFEFTETNAYSGNNGRAAILNNAKGVDVVYTVGNAGNGGNPQPNGILLGAGAQILTPANLPESAQAPGAPTPVASFSITELGAKADKLGKDDNFRGLTVFNNVLYFSKGSGSNGVNTVYFVDTTGNACPHGVGIPAPGAKLPTTPLAFDAATLATVGLPNNTCVLAGFPSTPNKSVTTTAFPFGIWFADAHTVYIADEGDGFAGGTDLYTHAAAQTSAGLQKWIFDTQTAQWKMAYVISAGLELGQPYEVAGYPRGNNAATALPWAPATDGLRNITGRVDRDGTVFIWGITSTISGNGDTGADPNRLVVAIDQLKNADPAKAAHERFVTLRTARFAEALRGVSFTPESDDSPH
jgi:hypothetical protein